MSKGSPLWILGKMSSVSWCKLQLFLSIQIKTKYTEPNIFVSETKKIYPKSKIKSIFQSPILCIRKGAKWCHRWTMVWPADWCCWGQDEKIYTHGGVVHYYTQLCFTNFSLFLTPPLFYQFFKFFGLLLTHSKCANFVYEQKTKKYECNIFIFFFHSSLHFLYEIYKFGVIFIFHCFCYWISILGT